MSYYALGLLETYGYIPAIVALDASLKASNVTVKDFQTVGGGLVTMMVQGDVSSVRAAIDAGYSAAQSVGLVVSKHVIPRPFTEVQSLLRGFNSPNEPGCHQKVISEALVEESSSTETEIKEEFKENHETISLKEKLEPATVTAEQELYNLKVVELRKMARGLEGFPMEPKEIKFANKSELVNAILIYLKEEVK